jgi:hypothetical protein
MCRCGGAPHASARPGKEPRRSPPDPLFSASGPGTGGVAEIVRSLSLAAGSGRAQCRGRGASALPVESRSASPGRSGRRIGVHDPRLVCLERGSLDPGTQGHRPWDRRRRHSGGDGVGPLVSEVGTHSVLALVQAVPGVRDRGRRVVRPVAAAAAREDLPHSPREPIRRAPASRRRAVGRPRSALRRS